MKINLSYLLLFQIFKYQLYLSEFKYFSNFLPSNMFVNIDEKVKSNAIILAGSLIRGWNATKFHIKIAYSNIFYL